MREVIGNTIIEGWNFEKGNTVMIPLRTNCQDPKTYGERIGEFVPDRFLKDFIKIDSTNSDVAGISVGKTTPSIKALKPFGGGVTFCPGWHFAGNETKAFIATALRFHIQLMEGQKEAKLLTTASALGTYPPDHDVFVRIRLRKWFSWVVLDPRLYFSSAWIELDGVFMTGTKSPAYGLTERKEVEGLRNRKVILLIWASENIQAKRKQDVVRV
jgi:Cytochrome P450